MFKKLQINGQKRLFILIGFLNFLITNAVLQISLLFLSTFASTIFSQTVNVVIGYFYYGKKVFKLNKLSNQVFKKYLILAIFIWSLNFFSIQLFFNFGVNKNITAVAMIPFLVLISYLTQKYFVFK